MAYSQRITDAELDIMRVLWKEGPMESPKLFAAMEHKKNIGTLKATLKNMVKKGVVRTESINSRHYMYFPVITEDEYLAETQNLFVNKVFKGSVQNMILNLFKN